MKCIPCAFRPILLTYLLKEKSLFHSSKSFIVPNLGKDFQPFRFDCTLID